VEEERLRPEIQQRDKVQRVEFPLAHGHNSKCGSQAREERIGEERWGQRAKGLGVDLYRWRG
jgi:hypothetical protein